MRAVAGTGLLHLTQWLMLWLAGLPRLEVAYPVLCSLFTYERPAPRTASLCFPRLVLLRPVLALLADAPFLELALLADPAALRWRCKTERPAVRTAAAPLLSGDRCCCFCMLVLISFALFLLPPETMCAPD